MPAVLRKSSCPGASKQEWHDTHFVSRIGLMTSENDISSALAASEPRTTGPTTNIAPDINRVYRDDFFARFCTARSP
jgi:hypothetical protein